MKTSVPSAILIQQVADIIGNRVVAEQHARIDARRRYRQLVNRSTAPEGGDAAEMVDLLTRLKLSVDDVAADCRAAVELAGLPARMEPLDRACAEMNATAAAMQPRIDSMDNRLISSGQQQALRQDQSELREAAAGHGRMQEKLRNRASQIRASAPRMFSPTWIERGA